jgi:SsrA-binding protein
MAESKKKQEKILVSQNKKAFHDFFILDRYEAGIALIGCEVKSIREHKVNLKDSFARIKNGEILVFNMHISPYANSRTEEINPTRVRKLLLHRREIDRIISKLKDKSITLVPISIYLDRGLVKIELATAKGKLKSDKRQDLEKKESELEIKRALKNRNRQYRS